MSNLLYKVFNHYGKLYFFDARTYSILEISPLIRDALAIHSSKQQANLLDLTNKDPKSKINTATDEINKLINNGTISTQDDLCLEAPTLNKLILLLDENCNLSCKYCFEDDKKPNQCASRKMSLNTIRESYDYLFRNSDYQQVNIQFYGGEPLLNKHGLKYAVEHGIQKSEKENKGINFLLITNGTLVDDDIASFLKQNNVTVQVSIDGDQKGHDANRIFKNGHGSYEYVKRGLDRFIKHGVICNVMVVASKHALKSFAWLEELSKSINGIVAISSAATSNRELQPTDDQLRDFLTFYEQHIASITNGYSQLNKHIFRIHRLSEQIKSGKRYYFGCGGGLSELTIGYDGSIYLCERMEMKTKYNVRDKSVKAWDHWRPYINNINHPNCSKCWAKYLCGGGCAHTARTLNSELKPYHWDCRLKQLEILSALKIICREKQINKR